ncbi:hypothetical protein [Microbacterium rhizophilus]|uniref:hypothetical protein n=1 Tax=Microbacterium rhizophilus TaxID=3138934 RepID=UPI0031E9185C
MAIPDTPARPRAQGTESPPLRSRLGIVHLLARLPLPIVALLLVLGAVLFDIQTMVILSLAATGAEEPPQWLARTTIMMGNLFIPVAVLSLWARRAAAQRRLGAIAASMVAVLPVVHVVLTIGTLVWGLVLGRGDIAGPFARIEDLVYVAYAGVVLLTIAFLRDRGMPRLVGVLMLLGFVLSYVVPWGITVTYTALGVIIVATSLRRRAPRGVAPREPLLS